MNALRRSITAGSVLALLGAWGPSVSAGAAAPLRCGQVVTRSTTLAADVGPCPADGIVVTGDHVVLNLNGHRVFGSAAPEAQGEFAGIRLLATSGVTVLGGTVDHFAAGVVIERGSKNTVRRLTVRDNISPCEREVHTQSPGLLGDGIVVLSSVANRVQDNLVEHNGPYSGVSLVAETDPVSGRLTGTLPSDNLVTRNTVRDSDTCFGDMGVRLEGPGANHNVVSANTVSGSFLEGIAVLSVLTTDISGFGVTCGDEFAFTNLPLCPRFDPPNPANTDNQIVGNHSLENALGQTRAGISLLAFPDTNNPQRNTIRGNRVERNGGSGIAMIAGEFDNGRLYGATDNTIVGNLSFDNNQDRCTLQTCGSLRYDLFDDSAGRPCDDNRWFGNVYGTAFPACTTLGGRQLPPPPLESAASSGSGPGSAPVPKGLSPRSLARR